VLLDLSESLACPRCGPPRGLVVLVDRMEGRRVRDGRLDCPGCENRFPLRDGVIRFDLAGAGPPSPASAADGPEEGPAGREEGATTRPAGDPDAEDAVVAAALLGIRHGRGVLVAGPGFAPAAELSRLCGGCEVVRVVAPEESPAAVRSQDAVTPLVGVAAGSLPLLAGRALGVVLAGGSPAETGEAARVLVPGGRLVVLRPVAGALEGPGGPAFEPVAADPRALVARRR
jgi:uncharacterized protein YbaR (Trm112 family)